MNTLETQLDHAANNVADLRDRLIAANSAANAIESLAIMPLIGEAAELERKIARVREAVRASQ